MKAPTSTSKLLTNLVLDLGRRHTPRTIAEYRRVAAWFLDQVGVKPAYSRQDLLGFLDGVLGEHSKNYARYVHYALKRLFKANAIPWPLDRDDVPPLPRRSELRRPVFSTQAIARLIVWCRAEGSPLEQTLLALATAYGLRREELHRLRTEDFTKNTVFIRTAKRGEERTHLIPGDIRPYLHLPYQTPSLSQLSALFRLMCVKAGIALKVGDGWHVIRRRLDTDLLERTRDYFAVKSFIRWAGARGDMPGHYYSQDEAKVDRLIFKAHPFLAFWGKGKESALKRAQAKLGGDLKDA